jgi:multiple sugar transport system permease protein
MADVERQWTGAVPTPATVVRRRGDSRYWLGQAALWAFILVGLVIMVVPGVWMVLSSVKTRAEITAVPFTLLPQALQWENYARALEQMRFGRVFTNSLIVTASVTVISVATSVWGGYTFGKLRWPGRDQVFLLLLATLMIPGFLTLIPRYVLTSKLGMINSYQGMIVPFMLSVFGIFLTKQFLLGIPDELLDAAKIDGASALGIFWWIIVPLCKPIMAVLAIFTFEYVWDDLLWGILILTNRDMWTLPVAIAGLRHQFGAFVELQMAGATMAVLPVLLVFIVLQKYIIRGVALSGLKG